MSRPSSSPLVRTLGLASVTSIVVANMIGTGIFTTSGLLVELLGDPRWMIALWAVGGVLALCGALSYGELGAAMPEAGGEYTFLSRLFHPRLGFLSGWVSLFAGFSAPIAASAIACADYLSRAVPGLDGRGTPGGKAVALAAIAAFTLLHARGLETGARVQNALTLLKVLLVVGLIAAGFAFGEGDLGHLSPPPEAEAPTPRSIGLALMWIMFAYSGWNAAAYIGSEISEPRRNLPLSLVLGTGIVTLLYLGLNLLFVYAVPAGEMGGVVSIGGLAAHRLFGAGSEVWLSAMIAVALLSSLSAFVILGPRVYYAMARDGRFFRFAGEVHPRWRVPSRSVLLQGAIAGAMVLLGTFDQILTYMGFALGLFPLLAVVGVFVLRRRDASELEMPGYPLAPLLYLAGGAAILVLGFLERPAESSIALAMVAAGIPAHWWFSRRGAQRPAA